MSVSSLESFCYGVFTDIGRAVAHLVKLIEALTEIPRTSYRPGVSVRDGNLNSVVEKIHHNPISEYYAPSSYARWSPKKASTLSSWEISSVAAEVDIARREHIYTPAGDHSREAKTGRVLPPSYL